VAFSVDDFQDLLRLLEEHPEWRAELRRQILTDELLELPAIVRQLAERMDQLAERMDQLAAAQARTEAQLATLSSRMDELAAAQARTEMQISALAGRVGAVEGELLAARYARLAPVYFSRLARRLRVIAASSLADRLDDAVAAGPLS